MFQCFRGAVDMKREKIGIVLEGGGMRGIYTVGVLDHFLEQNMFPDYVVGVSAGACHGVSYISKQHGRSYRINTGYLKDKRYASIWNYMKTKSIFGMDFLFDEIPHRLDPFDYDAFLSSPVELAVGVTDVHTGKPVYFYKEEFNRNSDVLRASSSIPVFSPIVEYKGGKYLDGGTADPIPVKKAIEDGCTKLIVILTRDRNYVKTPEKFRMIYRKTFKEYPEMIRLLDERHEIYNQALACINGLEKEGKAVVIAPSSPLTIGRFEKNLPKLEQVYQLGRRDAEQSSALLSGLLHTEAD